MYASRTLSEGTKRLFAFALPMMFITMWTDTFIPTATLAFATYGTTIFILPLCGSSLDKSHRLRSATVLIFAKSFFNAATMVILYVIFLCELHKTPTALFTAQNYGLFALLSVCAIAGETAEECWTICIERNWVVLVANGDEAALTSMNVAIRRIDLMALTLGPFLFGIALQNMSSEALKVQFGCWLTVGAFLTGVPEDFLIRKAYYSDPNLSRESLGNIEGQGGDSENPFTALCSSWGRYISHPVFLASLGYSALYLTVLDDHSGLTLSFLKWSGVPESVIGFSRGAGAISGLIGSFLFEYVKGCLGGSLEKTSSLTVWFFWFNLVPIGFVAYYGTVKQLGYALILCVTLSRCGVWLFDLSHALVMQEYVEERYRTEINSVQSATYRIFWLLQAILGLVFSDPIEYHILVYTSIGSVLFASVLVSIWAGCVSGGKPASPTKDGKKYGTV